MKRFHYFSIALILIPYINQWCSCIFLFSQTMKILMIPNFLVYYHTQYSSIILSQILFYGLNNIWLIFFRFLE